jgi:hypothetical protein
MFKITTLFLRFFHEISCKNNLPFMRSKIKFFLNFFYQHCTVKLIFQTQNLIASFTIKSESAPGQII